MGEKAKRVDFMAPPVTLNVGGSSGIKTYFGLLMSIGYLTSIAALSTFIVQDYLDDTKPKVAQESAESGFYPEINLNDNKLFPVSYVYFREVMPVPAAMVSKYFTIKLFKYSYKSIKSDSGSTIDFNVSFMDVVPCAEVMQNETLYSYYKDYSNTPFFQQFGKDLGLCVKVDPALMKVKGGGADSHLEILAYIFYPCSLPTGCATKEEMAEIGVVYSFPSTSMNFSNHEQPIQNYLNADNVVFVNTAMRQKFQGKLSITEVYDDPGLYFPLKLKSNVSSLDRIITTSRSRDPNQVKCTVQEMVADICSSYLVFDYMSSGKKLKIVRQYKGVVETLSDLGGVNSIVFLLFLWANYTYVEAIQQRHLVRMVFDFFNEKLFTTKPAQSSRFRCCKKNKLSMAKPAAALRSQASIVSMSDPNSLEPAVVKGLHEHAYKMIENSLDIVTLVKEINSLKVLTHFLLKDYHLKLVPLISLSLQCSKTKANLLGEARPGSGAFDAGGHRLSKQVTVLETASPPVGQLSYQSAVRQLQARASKPQGETVSSDPTTLEKRIDAFCLQSLAGGHFVFAELLKMSLQRPHESPAAGSLDLDLELPPSDSDMPEDPEHPPENPALQHAEGRKRTEPHGTARLEPSSQPRASQLAIDSSKAGFRPTLMHKKSLKLKVNRASVQSVQEDPALH